MSSTGNRCAIYDSIDGLDEARTVADLVSRLKPILNELAYYAVTGEAAVMETREEWHTTFTDRLYEDVGKTRASALAAPNGRDLLAKEEARAREARERERLVKEEAARAALNRTPGHGKTLSRRAPKPGGETRVPQASHSYASASGFGDSDERLPPAPPSNRPHPSDLSPALRAIMEGTHASFREDDEAI